MRLDSGPGAQMFEYQPPAVLTQPNPVNGTWYTVLPETENCRVYVAGVEVADVNETLGMQVILDGETLEESTLAATFATDYYGWAIVDVGTLEDRIGLLTFAQFRARGVAYLVEGHTVEVQVRKVTAAGAGDLSSIVSFGVKK